MSPTSIAITLEVRMAELGRKPMSLNLRRGECCSLRFYLLESQSQDFGETSL
ncbi:MAG: hypothetical protein VXY07_07960 [Planctomycetota bacterium]|nr:hypothetical protein [Planctomycetota bacterium]MEC8782748.1 hypothetical protein [Planctomycetota bacterium]MEC8862477.1 hypothetical protein [Planctomycetota bacterium]